MKTITSFLLALIAAAAAAQDIPNEYADVMPYLNKKGDFKAGVLKVNIPRNDLKVTVDGVAVPTAFGFGGWIAMTKGDMGMNMMMGDLVLLQDEVNPVMSALLDNGLEVTALHNHFFFENPRIFYMHVHGMGSPIDLAHKIKPALDLIGTIKPRQGDTPITMDDSVKASPINTSELDQIVGKTGDKMGDVYKYTVGRSDLTVKDMGATINARMGLNTWAAFYGSEDNAVVAGDIAMVEPEVNTVLKTLRANDLQIVAIHHHMTGTRPMIIFLHYWGKGPLQKLAKGFRATLDVLGHTKN